MTDPSEVGLPAVEDETPVVEKSEVIFQSLLLFFPSFSVIFLTNFYVLSTRVVSQMFSHSFPLFMTFSKESAMIGMHEFLSISDLKQLFPSSLGYTSCGVSYPSERRYLACH